MNTPLCPLMERCTSNRLSSLELSCQAMSIWLCPEPTAMGFDGAACWELAAFAADVPSGTARGPSGCSVQPRSSAAEVETTRTHDMTCRTGSSGYDGRCAAGPSSSGLATDMALGRANAGYLWMCRTPRKADMRGEAAPKRSPPRRHRRG